MPEYEVKILLSQPKELHLLSSPFLRARNYPSDFLQKARCTPSSDGACKREAAVNTALTSVAVFTLMGRSFIPAATYSLS
ncbi:hypothetical protein NPIL_572091 [Nephila pilipes]|uniref:Uncharacterized protein n=1 Tax=Nephila pilipes TaxID=299642 RepID=A0A8X6MXW1_NEPPI|nr:hypothetical protein NPIL_572091 [Nephila pilipes]